jgi:YesN/AraC family two-component response regulator
VLTSKDGKEGIEMALKHIPDIILSDVMMPLVNGVELCHVLKNSEWTSHIPIILLTAKSGDFNEISGLQSGADDYITKPFNPKTLQVKINNIIESRRTLQERYKKDVIFKPKDIAITPSDEVFLGKVKKVLDKHLNNPDFNSEFFSKEIGMSRMQLHRKLLVYTGLNTSAFIRSQRLIQAIQILKTSNLTVNEVAYMVGFNTPSYFMKCFKETYGKTPTEYIN